MTLIWIELIFVLSRLFSSIYQAVKRVAPARVPNNVIGTAAFNCQPICTVLLRSYAISRTLTRTRYHWSRSDFSNRICTPLAGGRRCPQETLARTSPPFPYQGYIPPASSRGHGGMAGTSPKVSRSKGYVGRGGSSVRYGRTNSIRSLVCRKNRKCIKEAGIPTVTANSTPRITLA